MSTESIASPTPSIGAPEPCARCGAPLAEDQRYCLECGERRLPMSSVLAGGPPGGSPSAATGAEPPLAPPSGPPRSAAGGGEGRGNAVTVIAGVGVLLLAVGVGVLIGRSGGSSQQGAAALQVISVASTPAGGASAGAAVGAAFSDDWPAGTTGYTVQLQTLAQSSTQPSAVAAAKTAAGGKGAKEVGALKSEDFGIPPAGNYVVYSGVYHKKADAEKALAGLKKSFPDASVIKVSSAGASSAGAGAGGAAGAGSSGAGGSGGGTSSHPAGPKVLEELHKTKGKSYEEKSKNLPDVVGT